VFCIYLRTNSDLCHLQHKLIGFYNPDEKCLQRGTDWGFKYSGLRFVFRRFNNQASNAKHFYYTRGLIISEARTHYVLWKHWSSWQFSTHSSSAHSCGTVCCSVSLVLTRFSLFTSPFRRTADCTTSNWDSVLNNSLRDQKFALHNAQKKSVSDTHVICAHFLPSCIPYTTARPFVLTLWLHTR